MSTTLIVLVFFPFYSTPPDNVSIQEFQKNEAIDVEVNNLFLAPSMSTSFCEVAHISIVSSSF